VPGRRIVVDGRFLGLDVADAPQAPAAGPPLPGSGSGSGSGSGAGSGLGRASSDAARG
jgi:hypothetical protein